MRLLVSLSVGLLMACPSTPAPGDDDDAAPDDDDAAPEAICAPLPEPPPDAVRVVPGDAANLPRMIREAAAGTTFLLADGRYPLGANQLNIRADGLTLRSESGDREAVVIDAEYSSGEPVNVGANDVTVADLTVLNAYFHGIKVSPGGDGDITGTVIHDVVLRDHRQQFVKINTAGSEGDRRYADEGVVRCSLFDMTDDGRPEIEPDPGGCYTGGVDAHQARGWRVHDNEFRGIHCTNGSVAEHAVHFWTSSRDTVVERNTIFDCARGVGFGLGGNGGAEGTPHRIYEDDPYPGVGYVGHYDGVIRNNLIVGRIDHFDTGIELQQARGAAVHHNTIVTMGSAAGFFSSIDYRYVNTLATIDNNITRRITVRNDGAATLGQNLETTDFSGLFVDVDGDDFRLSADSAARGAGTPVADPGLDLDGNPHDPTAPNLGAYAE